MKTDAKKIHQVSIADSPSILENTLRTHGLSFDDIDYLIPHQTSRSSIKAGMKHYAEYFGAKPANLVVNLKEFGNTASTTHFLAMYRYLKENRFKHGDRIMLLSFASGLVIGVVVFTINGMAQHYGN